MRVGAIIPTANEWRFMSAVVGQALKIADRCLILRNRRAFSGAPLTLRDAPPVRAEIVEGEWPDEAATRNAGMAALADCDYVLTLDSDEVLDDATVAALRGALGWGRRCVCLPVHTYWKSPRYRIEYASRTQAPVAPIACRADVRFERLRMPMPGEVTLIAHPMHHLSYVHDDEGMRAKLRTFGHASEVVPGWFGDVWLAWEPEMENLHPTTPALYRRALPIVDAGLERALREHGCG